MHRRLVVLLLLAAAGCAPAARYLHTTPTGGTLQLEGDPRKADQEAARLMKTHCPGGYEVLGEKERMTGTDAERLQMARLRYACKPAAAAPAPAADAAPDGG
jgi:hypothetical protein